MRIQFTYGIFILLETQFERKNFRRSDTWKGYENQPNHLPYVQTKHWWGKNQINAALLLDLTNWYSSWIISFNSAGAYSFFNCLIKSSKCLELIKSGQFGAFPCNKGKEIKYLSKSSNQKVCWINLRKYARTSEQFRNE